MGNWYKQLQYILWFEAASKGWPWSNMEHTQSPPCYPSSVFTSQKVMFLFRVLSGNQSLVSRVTFFPQVFFLPPFFFFCLFSLWKLIIIFVALQSLNPKFKKEAKGRLKPPKKMCTFDKKVWCHNFFTCHNLLLLRLAKDKREREPDVFVFSGVIWLFFT